MVDGGEFAGTICSICYEGLKPVTEDLQSISICGHVFHELCLQQWFEYCSKSKKQTCPVCKQSCKGNDACRLYFQSVGDASDAVPTQKCVDFEEDAGVLRRELKRFEVKVSGLSSVVERQKKELQELNEELCACKEKAKIESAFKNEAIRQKASIHTQLNIKLEELNKTTSECSKLRDQNMALAKEVAALKLVADVDLDEDEILKLATLGNGANSKDTIDTLKSSLVLRNRSYKELMAKCNVLGRGEARYSKKHEKAKEKIIKLKARVHELERAAEVKENEYLMSLKVSKKTKSSKTGHENSTNSDSDVFTASKFSLEEQCKQILTPKSGIDLTANSGSNYLQSLKIQNSNSTKNEAVNISNGSKTTLSMDKVIDCILIDDDTTEFTKALPGGPKHSYKGQDRDDVTFSKPLAKPEAAPGIETETSLQRKCNLVESSRVDIGLDDISTGNMDEDVSLQANVKQAQPVVNIRKESPLTLSSSASGDICFSGGLIGPDGTHRYLGKWCKRGQNSESTSAKGSSNGDLISVGADGRGGRIKVLRTQGQSFPDGKENSTSSKRLKLGPKTSSLQSRGCLQIEHFFGRASQ